MIRTISQDYRLGNSAQSRLDNPFENTVKSTDIDEVWYDQYGINERTQIVMSDVKTIVNKVDISDVGLQYSISHYQVCEHGVLSSYPCNAITCWGHGAGLDSEQKIVVKRNAAPIIPGLNDEGIFTLVKVAADYGATDINHVILRLNGEVAKVFKDWARKSFPYRWRKILRKVADVHKGRIGSNALGVSVRGGGQYAEMLTRQFSIAKRTYGMQASERAQ